MLVDSIQSWATRHPDKLAVVRGAAQLTYRQFADAIGRLQQDIVDVDIGTAVILTRDLLDAWLLSLSARALGHDAIVVGHPGQIEGLALRNVSLILADASERAGLLALGRDVIDPGRLRVLPQHFAESDGDRRRQPEHANAFGSQILYTTGTTGTSKKVVMEGRLESRRNHYRAESFGVTGGTVAYTDLPPSCGAGFKTPSAVWHAGGTVIFDPSLDLLSALRRHGVTSVLAGPIQLRAFLGVGALPDDLRHSFEIVYTSGPLPHELARAATERLTRHINIYYGATEIIGRPLRSSFSGIDDLLWLQPEPGRKIRILDEAGQVCGPNAEGLLAIEVADVDATAYLDDPEASARIFQGGYFVPGDRAIMREDGRVRLLGREADVINISGRKRSVMPLESAIQDYLKAHEVCIFAELNAAGEEEAIVAVRIDRNLSSAEMEEIVRRYLPFGLVRFARLSQFPRSEGAFGKTLRGELRKMLYATKPSDP